MTTTVSQNKINFYPNDPSAMEAPLEQIPYEKENIQLKWNIQGPSPSIGLYNPDTLEFQTYQINYTLYRSIGLWKNIFQDSFNSWSTTENLNVIPELDYKIEGAKNGFNAFYDREKLAFYFDVDDQTHKTAYTCESVDVVAHENGHACLDAVHPDFWNVLLPEIPAFHEAFGDCSAILTTLTDSSVRKSFLKIQDPLKESNFVSRLAEQLGHGIFSRYGRDKSSAESLRDAINDFKYKDPLTLPNKGSDTILTKEGHSFARVFVGAFYGTLVKIYQLLSQEIIDKDKALIQAANHAGQLLGTSILMTTVTPKLFKEIATGILKADQQLFQGKYKQSIIDAFIDKGILSSVASSSFENNTGMHSFTGSAKSLKEIKIPEDMNEIKSQRFIQRISDLLGIKDNNQLSINVKKGPRPNSMLVEGKYEKFITLKAGYGELPDEIEAYVPSGFTIMTDPESKSISSHSHAIESNTIEQAQSFLQHLSENNKIYIPKNDEKINTTKLSAMHKPYYISDKQRILRAYFA
jgi:hypothetical protein